MKASFSTRQKGASLLVGLILLLVATIIVFAGMRGTQMQERMTSNLNNKAISLKAAETGASNFLVWIEGQLANGGWPTAAVYNASALPKADQSSVAVTNNTISGRYWFDNVVWDPAFVTFVSIGDANGLAESRVRVRINAPGGNPPGWIDPPAAISCLGPGGCTVSAGQGQAQVDGHNFNLPPSTCNGRKSCFDDVTRVNNPPDSPPFRVPGAYFENVASNTLDQTGATSACKYTGLPFDDQLATDWSKTDDGDGCNNSTFKATYPGGTLPDRDAYFGTGGLFNVKAGSEDLGTREKPLVTYIDKPFKESGGGNFAGLLVIDGIDFITGKTTTEIEFAQAKKNPDGTEAEFKGNTVYEGVIVIRNCGRLNMGGTAFVYGAIIVDTVTDTGASCGTNYDPFSGNGTPNVRYSFAGLGSSGQALGGGTELRVVEWIDSLI